MKRKTKECQRCNATRKEFGGKLVEMAVEVEKRDLMLDALAKTIERAEIIIKVRRLMGQDDVKRIYAMQDEATNLIRDLQLVQSGCTREMGGSVWIRGEQLAEVLRRYTEQNDSVEKLATLLPTTTGPFLRP